MAQYKVTLTSDERNQLDDICKTGKGPAKQGIYARCLLLLDRSDLNPTPHKEKEVAELMGVVPKTLQHLKKRLVEEGLEAALGRKAYTVPSHRIKYDGKFEAQVVALACGDAPDGHARWTIRLLRDKVVELGIAPSVTTTTIFNTLKKTRCTLTRASTGRFRRTTMENS